MRIVSLLPSATEIIYALGLKSHLVGVSHECDFPADVASLPSVTHSTIDKNQSSSQIDQQVRDHLQTSDALYMLDLELLESLQPDLIVTQALCDVCAVSAEDVESAICKLSSQPEIVNLEPSTLTDVLKTIERVGEVTKRQVAAQQLIDDFHLRMHRVRQICQASDDQQRVVCLEWLDPPFNAGHWTPELIELAGGLNVTGDHGNPSSTMTWQKVVDARPDVLFIACCGYSIDRTLKDLPVLADIPALRDMPFWINERIYVADGNHYFNRPGPRLIDSLEMLAAALHPQLALLSTNGPAAMHINTSQISR